MKNPLIIIKIKFHPKMRIQDLTILQKQRENKSGLSSKPNILVKNKKRNESSDNISNISGTSSNAQRRKASAPGFNVNKKPSFISNGPFKNVNIDNNDEPLIKPISRRKIDADEALEKNNELISNALNMINLAINNEQEADCQSYNTEPIEQKDTEDMLNENGSLDPLKKPIELRETPNFRIEDQESMVKSDAKPRFEEIREEPSEHQTEKSPFKHPLEGSVYSQNSHVGDEKSIRYSRRLDELKRQQAKLDKIKNEKDQLQAFLNYQQEIEEEKERKRIEEMRQLEIKYNNMAIVIQKYSRVWLAKRYVSALQEEEHKRQKALLYQALNEMKDQIRTCGTDSKERFVTAAITIQKFVRGIFIRRLLAPYFELYRRLNPLVEILTSAHINLRKRSAFKVLKLNANIQEKSEEISQIDLEEEQQILRNIKKKEFMGENQNENLLEIQINNSQNDNSVNQTYKMIMDAHNITNNNNDFSIEDASSEDGEDENSEDEYFEDNNLSKGKETYLDNKEIEPIAEEDGEESKYAPTPQKTITTKIDYTKAICNTKNQSKESEKRLELYEKNDVKENKTFKSADAQKPKATLKENKSLNVRQLPPKVPNRSSTSNENPKDGVVPGSYFKGSAKQIPSTTKASTTSETPKSFSTSNLNKAKPVQKNTANESKLSSDGDKANQESCRALMLYESHTVASKQKKQEAYKPDEVLPPWGIQSINTKNVLAKRVTSATTRSTITPRGKNLKRGKSSASHKLAIQQDCVNKTEGHIQKDIKIRKNKGNRSRQRKKNETRKINTSSSHNTKRAKLSSKERVDSMKRLGIGFNQKSSNGQDCVEDTENKIQTFLNSFFSSQANAGKFTDAEKKKFTTNFKKAFIENQIGSSNLPKKNAQPKLKALPAPPVIKELEKKPIKKQTLPAIPKSREEEKPKSSEQKFNSNENQRLGNVKMYSNMFTNNYNFVKRNTEENESHHDTFSNMKASEQNESIEYCNQDVFDTKYYSPDSDQMERIRRNFGNFVKPVEKVEYTKQEPSEFLPIKDPAPPKVSSTFGESLPVMNSLVKMYGKSFMNVNKAAH